MLILLFVPPVTLRSGIAAMCLTTAGLDVAPIELAQSSAPRTNVICSIPIRLLWPPQNRDPRLVEPTVIKYVGTYFCTQ